MYRCAEEAYAALDFNGKGYVDEQSFFDNLVVKRLPFQKQQIKEFLNYSSLFTNDSTELTFDIFKK